MEGGHEIMLMWSSLVRGRFSQNNDIEFLEFLLEMFLWYYHMKWCCRLCCVAGLILIQQYISGLVRVNKTNMSFFCLASSATNEAVSFWGCFIQLQAEYELIMNNQHWFILTGETWWKDPGESLGKRDGFCVGNSFVKWLLLPFIGCNRKYILKRMTLWDFIVILKWRLQNYFYKILNP